MDKPNLYFLTFPSFRIAPTRNWWIYLRRQNGQGRVRLSQLSKTPGSGSTSKREEVSKENSHGLRSFGKFGYAKFVLMKHMSLEK
jgi:hypothetical protein